MRVSATTLEAFRLYLTEDWMEEAALLDTIRGVIVPTPPMLLGRAFHAVLETPERYQVPHGYVCDGYQFADATMNPLLALIDRRGVFEVKTTKTIDGVTLVAQADQLCGAALHEFKTTESAFAVEKYIDSIQWKVMTWLFEPAVIQYHVATLDDHGNGVIELRDLNHLALYPYAGLVDECRDLVRQFVDYVRARDLEPLLRERQQTASVQALA